MNDRPVAVRGGESDRRHPLRLLCEIVENRLDQPGKGRATRLGGFPDAIHSPESIGSASSWQPFRRRCVLLAIFAYQGLVLWKERRTNKCAFG